MVISHNFGVNIKGRFWHGCEIWVLEGDYKHKSGHYARREGGLNVGLI